LLQHADVEVAQRRVVFEVFDDVALMFVAAAGEDDREVFAGVGGGVAEVGDVEDGGAVEEAASPSLALLHGGEEAAEKLQLGLLDDGELLDLGFVFAVMRGVVVFEAEAVELGASGLAHGEQDDAGGVGLEGEADDVEPERFAGDEVRSLGSALGAV
jgi:hypothetical protein